MDIVTMAMAKPKVIKLADFHDSDGRSLNNAILELLVASLASGSTWQNGTFEGEDAGRFLNSVKQGKQYVFEFSIMGMPLVMGATLSFDDSGANQIIMNGTAFNEGGLNEFTLAIMKVHTEALLLYVKGATVA